MFSVNSRRVLACVFWSVIAATFITGVEGLKIKELRVPDVVQNGSISSVILDCDYTFEDDSRDGLVVKWFFNKDPAAVYQWIPPQKPQGLGALKGKLNLGYRASNEEHKKHRALEILNPTTELSGEYKCTVSTFDGEQSKEKNMIIFVPPEKMIEITQTKQNENSAVNLTCSAEGVFPEPKLFILNEEGSKMENVHTETIHRNGLYDIHASIVIEDGDLESPTSPTKFDCELEIPEANYTVKTSSLYYPGPPTSTTPEPQASEITPDANTDVDSSASSRITLSCALLLPLLALRL